jgi:hypothetical protein
LIPSGEVAIAAEKPPELPPATHRDPFQAIVLTRVVIGLVTDVQLIPSEEYAIAPTEPFVAPTATHIDPFQAIA